MPFRPEGIHELRERTGMRPFEIAAKLGCTPQTVVNWEKGHSVPSMNMLDNLYGFCNAEGISHAPTFYTPPPNSCNYPSF